MVVEAAGFCWRSHCAQHAHHPYGRTSWRRIRRCGDLRRNRCWCL